MPKAAIAPIEADRLRLRLLTEADLPLTLQWRNQDHIRRWFIYSDIITPQQHWAWFELYHQRDDDFVFIIEEKQYLQRPVGQVSLYNIAWAEKRAEFGRLLIGDSEAQGQGLARRATQLLLTTAFNQLGLNDIYLEVFKDNASAVAIYRKCGFQPMGERDGLISMSLFKSPSDEE
jgi:RimJ/RimL family protein N-acetyltransferase